MDLDKLKNLVRNDEFGAITLDTSIFDSQGLRLESGLLKQLEQFQDSSTKLIISEIVKEEILSHLIKKAQESKTSIGKSLRQIKEHWIVEEQKIENIKEIILINHRAEEIAGKRFNKFLKSTSLEIIKAEDNISVSELIKKYFHANPPFAESGKKKNEFPGAIALMSLETWAINHKTKIIVISSDHDWNNFCENSEYLVAINDLGQALGLFQLQNTDDICDYLSERYEQDGLENLQDHILSSLNHHINNINFSLSPASDFLYEEELEGVTINEFKFNSLDYSNTIFRPINIE